MFDPFVDYAMLCLYVSNVHMLNCAFLISIIIHYMKPQTFYGIIKV